MTAMTREVGARWRTTPKLWRSAAVSMIAQGADIASQDSLTEDAVAVGFGDEIFEFRVFAKERERNFPGGTITLLRDNDVRDPFTSGIFVVNLIAIDQQDQVGVLFDGARFAQIRHDGFLVGALFDATIKL